MWFARARCSKLPISMPSARRSKSKLEREVNDYEFASYLMYPKVFTDYALAAETYGPVSVLPTPAYFYGMAPGEELFADLEKGKTLVILNQTQGEIDEKGMVKVFFELNGQPRPIKVPDRNRGASSAIRRKAEAGNATQSRRADAGRDLDGLRCTRARRSRRATCCCRSKR